MTGNRVESAGGDPPHRTRRAHLRLDDGGDLSPRRVADDPQLALHDDRRGRLVTPARQV